MKRINVLNALAVVLAGCSSMAQQQADPLDYGPYPAHYKQTVEKYMQGYLTDPSSAQFRYLNIPFTVATTLPVVGLTYGYLACVGFNAGSRFGGNTGSSVSAFIIRNETVVDVTHSDSGFSAGAVQKLCGGRS